MLHARLLLLAVLSQSACYARPGEISCTVQCGAGGTCPEDFACRANNLCGAPDDLCTNVPPPPNDAAIDAVDPDARMCFGHGVAPFLTVCISGTIGASRTFVNETIQTGAAQACTLLMPQQDPSAPMVCVIAATTIRIVGTVPVIGPYPLLLLGIESVHVEQSAILDLASHSGGTASPAGTPGPLCNAGNGTTASPDLSSGGGAGGAFGGAGGSAGPGGSNGAAGTPQPIQSASFLRGGCPGGNGGDVGGNTGGRGGGAGGAVYLMSRNTITVQGGVNASGAGAEPADMHAGGGGGGSGGMIVLDAPTMILTGRMFALGGGGSSGGVPTGPGSPGNDPAGIQSYADRSAPPPGQAGFGGGGGAPYNGLNGDAGGAGSGGGGGGGAGGVIRLRPPVPPLVGNVDPPPT